MNEPDGTRITVGPAVRFRAWPLQAEGRVAVAREPPGSRVGGPAVLLDNTVDPRVTPP